MEAESVTFNENKLIQEWVDEEIKYPYMPLDLRNQKYKQMIAKIGFTEEVVTELMKRWFTCTQVDRHIKEIRHRFGFDVRRSGSKRGKHIPPAKLPEIIFTEEKGRTVPVTTGATVFATNSATPATSSLGGSVPPMGKGKETIETMEQTIGRIIMADPGDDPSWRERTYANYLNDIFSINCRRSRRTQK